MNTPFSGHVATHEDSSSTAHFGVSRLPLSPSEYVEAVVSSEPQRSAVKILSTEPPPESVLHLAKIAENFGIQLFIHQNAPTVSTNDNNQSCAAIAPRRRTCLNSATAGVPLYAELKSGLYTVTNLWGEQSFVAVHSRGNDAIDSAKLRKCLPFCAEMHRTEAAELEALGLAYGLVNPLVLAALDDPPLQIFDRNVFLSTGEINTVTTNASHRDYGIEIDPHDLLVGLRRHAKNPLIADVVLDSSHTLATISHVLRQQAVGISSGNGYQTAVLFQDYLCEVFEAWLRNQQLLWYRRADDIRPIPFQTAGDFTRPRVTTTNNPRTGLSMDMENNWDTVLRHDLETFEKLARDGMTTMTVPCCTRPGLDEHYRQYCGEQLGVSYLSMKDALRAKFVAIREENPAARVLVIGGRDALLSPSWGMFHSLRQEFDFLFIPSERDIEELNRQMLLIKGTNEEGRKALNTIVTVLKGYFDQFDTLILGATEWDQLKLSSNSAFTGAGKKVVSSLRTYAEYVVEQLVAQAEAAVMQEPSFESTSDFCVRQMVPGFLDPLGYQINGGYLSGARSIAINGEIDEGIRAHLRSPQTSIHALWKRVEQSGMEEEVKSSHRHILDALSLLPLSADTKSAHVDGVRRILVDLSFEFRPQDTIEV